jgi:surface carbohydrate biosynthesis protein
MIIYLTLEVVARELPGHLLLASEASNRGHQTFICDINGLLLLARLRLLRPGVLLVKNVNMSEESIKTYEIFRSRGIFVCAHEQEPSILWNTFEQFLFDMSIDSGNVTYFDRVFAWGPRDYTGYKELAGDGGGVIKQTGSPRADLWTRGTNATEVGSGTLSYILIVSNFGFWFGELNWTSWLSRERANGVMKDVEAQDRKLEFMREDFVIAMHMVQGVRALSKALPTAKILIRPHPIDSPQNWRHVFEDLSNVEVSDNQRPLSDVICGASVVVQNGCTSALEAVIQQKPLISFGPEREFGNISIPNSLGHRVRGVEELVSAVDVCATVEKYSTIQRRSDEIVAEVLHPVDGKASARIIRGLEELDADGTLSVFGAGMLGVINSVFLLKRAYDRMRGAVGAIDEYESITIPPVAAIDSQINDACTRLNVPKPWVHRMASRCLVVSARRH